MLTSRSAATAVLGLVLATSTSLRAQSTGSIPIDFSGVIFANYQVRTDSAARAATGGQAPNKFDLTRVYLTFRMSAGERASIRVTTDIFQQLNAPANAFYSGWALRLKYAYLQYDFTKNLAGVQGLGAVGRMGMLHNVIVEQVDTYWPRWIGIDALEQHGFFSSADVGAAGLFTLPNRRGEVYATIVNGSTYSSAEADRYKDYALRFTYAPFAHQGGFLRTFAVSPWYSLGGAASQFVLGGPTQVGPVSDGLQKDRRGIFAGIRDRRLTGGIQFAQRLEDVEAGANTVAAPRTVSPRTGNLVDGFALVRPVEIFRPGKPSRFGLLGRLDHFEINRDLEPANRFVVLGAFYDVTAKTSFALDYQELQPRSGSTTIASKIWFLHYVANF